ncbi:MAG TPA: glycosyltransferase family 4 protein [Pyrinomonadaceae bacterium]
MKILFYNHTAQVSGAERVLMMILSRLNRDQFMPVVLCPTGPMMEMASALGVPCQNVEQLSARFTWRIDHLFRYAASFIRAIRSVRARVVGIQPDIIHANSIRAGLVMTFATAGLDVPVIWHAHDLLRRHPLSTAIRFFACASGRNSILAVSHAVADRFRGLLIRWFSRRVPVRVIHNAVDLERFQPNPESRREIRRALGFTERERVVGIVGHLTPDKGQLELIQAFAAVSRETSDVVLLVVGEALFNRGADYAECLVRAASSFAVTDRVRFLGPRDDVPALMQGFDLLVVNSRTEGFPLAVLEGLASGTPVIATAVGGIPEMIRHRENGWLVPAQADHSLAAGILTLLSDPELRATLARRGREEVSAHYSAERYISDMQSFYRQAGNVRTTVTLQTQREASENA